MKSVLLSVRPEWIAKILNGEKTIEIRKKFPSDYVGWVYIYCTKEQGLARLYNGRWNDTFVCEKDITDNEFKRMYSGYDGKGKVVGRFWCDKVEYVENTYDEFRWGEEDYSTETLNPDVLYEKSCLSFEEMDKYLKGDCGYAIHITKLEIFDKPKEISEFMKVSCKGCPFENTQTCHNNTDGRYCKLTRAPQSWQFIEV